MEEGQPARCCNLRVRVYKTKVVVFGPSAALEVTADVKPYILEFNPLMGVLAEHGARLFEIALLLEAFINHKQIVIDASRMAAIAVCEPLESGESVAMAC